jgi:hypothetical protein
MSSFRQVTAISLVLLALSACGGGSSGGGESDVQPPPTTPSYSVTTAVTGSGSGSISPESVTVLSGDTTTFTVTPNSGHQIESVTGCGGSLSGNVYTTGAITANCSVVASFRDSSTPEPAPVFTVTVTAGDGGSVSPTILTVEQGTSVTITASPNTGYLFLHWIETRQNVVVSSDREYTFSVESDTDLIAQFELQQLVLEPATLLIDDWQETYQLDLVVLGLAGEPATIEVVSEPQHGAIEFDATALRVSYSPFGVGFNEDTFELRVASGARTSEPQVYPVHYRDTNGNGLPDFIDPEFSGARYISGIVEEDQRLSAGRYVINGDLQVRNGITLQVDAGAVLFLEDGVEIVVGGALVIDASYQLMARLLPATINPAGWRGIRFIDGHDGSEISGSSYVGGTLFRGAEIAGVAELAGARAINFCSGTPQQYLFEEVLIHGSIGNEGINFIGKCTSLGTVPEIFFNRSVAYVDDRSFLSGWPTRVFNTARVNMLDSVVFGYSIYGLADLMDVLRIDRSRIDLAHAADWAIPMVQLTYRSAGLESTVKNSRVSGDIEINRGFDQSLFPIGPEVSSNILEQKGTDYLLIAKGANTPDDTIRLQPNYYSFETTEADGILDGRQDVSLPFIDISNQLSSPPSVGPAEAALPILNTLIEALKLPN